MHLPVAKESLFVVFKQFAKINSGCFSFGGEKIPKKLYVGLFQDIVQ